MHSTSSDTRRAWPKPLRTASLVCLGLTLLTLLLFLIRPAEWLLLTALLLLAATILFQYKLLRHLAQTERRRDQTEDLLLETVSCLAMAIDAKDQCQHGHIQRVQAICMTLAEHLQLRDHLQLEALCMASLLHDIGKLAIPEYILNKPAALTEWESLKVETHSAAGAEILSTVLFPYPVAPLIRHHHERWDGSGYPDGLQGEDIPIGARILAVADTYDTLRSDRPYRSKLSQEASLEYLKVQSGTSFDPRITDCFLAHLLDIEAHISAVDRNLPDDALRQIEKTSAFENLQPPRIEQTVFHNIASAHKEVQAIHDISQAVGKSLNVAETLTILTSSLRNIVPYDACAVFLFDQHDDYLSPDHTAGADADTLNGILLQKGKGVTGWVARHNEIMINASPAEDFGEDREVAALFQSCLAVPWAIGERMLAVITFYSRTVSAFDEDQSRLMQIISPQAARALHNAIAYEETQEDAYTDVLTGLPNLRYFKVFAKQELTRAERVHYSVSFLMMDLDRFKEVNDTYGHRAGDQCLIEIAGLIKKHLRRSDICIRYGGDELVAILPGADNGLEGQTIERLRNAVAMHEMTFESGESAQVGISIGSATFPEDGSDLEDLITMADKAMYRDKLLRSRQNVASGSILTFDRREK